ncbi:DUF6923 family protein [Streptomyces sp. AK02-04a]|uniref:DUF6923 family protein n=1 Tax=Streptomyces sp. AK02-04a TaxID=3028649 RepID=UPI0029A00E15|nr:hypothetical protein [Streptomyces sp. AK02-04a]MDX3763980.1 hypothetical protein [Streptomyces sp. AK02-04a]
MTSVLWSLRLRAGLLLVGTVASCAGVELLGAPQATAAAADGFACNGQVFQSAGDNQVRLYTGTDGSGKISFSPLGPAVPSYNAIGVDPKTRYIFGIGNRNNLVRINNKGEVTRVGTVNGLPAPSRGGYIVGAFDTAGNYYVMNPGASTKTVYRVNVNTRTVTSKLLLAKPVLPGMADFTYSGGYFWGAAGRSGAIQRINPATGAVTNFTKKVPVTVAGYGGAFTYRNGDLGFLDNKGFLVRVAVANPDSASPTLKLVSKQASARPSAANDATACFVPGEVRADLQVVKTGPVKVPVGGPVTYKITVTNHGPAASSGWTVSDTLPTELLTPHTSTPGCTITGGQLSCIGGRLAAGASTTISVTGTAPTPTLDSTVTVRGNNPDPTPGNNTSSFTTHVGS